MAKTRKKSDTGTYLSLEDYFSGGYFITRKVSREDWMKSEYLPALIVSVSRCLADILPDLWTIDWVVFEDRERRKKARRFNLPPHAMVKVIEYMTQSLEENEIGWPGVFYSLDSAHQFVNAHLDQACEYQILGIGLHEKLISAFLESRDVLEEKAKYGIYEAISRQDLLDSSGIPLGFEILGYHLGDFHSWLCNGLHLEIEKEFGFCPNRSGLISNFKDACKASIFIDEEALNAEPGIWMPWLLVEY